MRFNGILSAAIVALAAEACQKVEEQSPNVEPAPAQTLTVTATIADIDGTKVSYAFDPESNKGARASIKQAWEVGDEIFGFDESGDTFTFTVSEVDDKTGKATFNAAETNLTGKLYAVYYPGSSHTFTGEGADKTLAVDLSGGNGVLNIKENEKSVAPVIMCATASIDNNGAVSFKFVNQTAIVGIYKMQIKNNGASVANGTITSVTLNNVITTGTIKIVKEEGSDVLKLCPGTEMSSITASGLSLSPDASGYITVETPSAPYFSIIPGNSEISVSVSDGNNTYRNQSVIPAEALDAGTYYYLGKVMDTKTVASIGEGESKQEFATIDDAFRAVKDGETISLDANCEFGTEIRFPAEKWTKSSKIELNLNSHTLTGKYVENIDKHYRIVLDNENVELTITGGGTITSTYGDANIIEVEAGNLVVNGATIQANSNSTEGGNAAIWVQGPKNGKEQTNPNASVTIKEGTIKGAESVSDNKNAYALYVNNTNATVKIEGGTFSSQSHNVNIVNAKAGVSITGGTFACTTTSKPTLSFAGNYTCNIGDDNGNGPVVSSASNPITIKSNGIRISVKNGKFKTSSTSAAIVARGNYDPTISITGGKFSKSSSYIVAGHTCCKTELENDYPWEVVGYGESKALVITSGSESYKLKSDINDAVTTANENGGKIILVDNCTVKGTDAVNVNNSTGVTLDLNGKTLTQNKSGRVGVTTGGKLTITDSQTGGEITQAEGATNQYTISVQAGQLDIESGTISNTDAMTVAAVCVGTNGKLNFKGGKIISGTNESDSNHALYIIGSAQVEITGGTITGNGEAASAIRMYNANAQMTIDGKDVSIDAPKIDVSGKTTTPVILLSNGMCTLKNGTIGKNNTTGHPTAIQIVSGDLDMQGGTVYAQRFAIYFNGITDSAGSAEIKGGELINTKQGYNIVRFNTSSKNILIFNGGYLYLTNGTTSGKLFGTGAGSSSNPTTSTIPATAEVTINAGYFNQDVTTDYSDYVSQTSSASKGSFEYNQRSYVCRVVKNN